MKNALLGLLFLALISCSTSKKEWVIESPDSNIKTTVFIKEEAESPDNGKLFYKVEILKDGNYETAVNPSPLGLTTNQENFTIFSDATSYETLQIDEEYEMISGKQLICHNLANEAALTFDSENETKILLRLRAYNDGVAFRYELLGEGERTVEKEETGFSIPEDAKTWIPTYDKATQTTPAYETYYTNGANVGEDAPESQGWSFPAMFNTNGTWLLISEAGVYENYCGSHLDQNVENGTYKIRFPEEDERYVDESSSPTSELSWKMPWRFILVGNDLNTIVQSDMVYNLSEPRKVENTDWIKPGRSSWSWWSSRTDGRKMDTLKQYADLAKEMGWEYNLVDAFWENTRGGTVEEFIDYSNKKGVGVWLWYNSGGRTEPRFAKDVYMMEDPDLRKKEMKRIHDLGVKGIKVDFFGGDKQNMMKLYLDILKDAADNELMVNFHGCTMPRGWRRTYPNLMSMEAIRGAECYRYDRRFPENAPWHNTIAFFVRNTIGPMDYTPVTFSNQVNHHTTTYAHELALSVLFESGIFHLADKAESYQSLDGEVKEFLSKVPNVWEEIQLIDGYPGEFTVVARKSKDNKWYVAGINGETPEKQINMKFDFLADDQKHSMKIFKDDTPTSFNIEKSDVSKDKTVEVSMLPRGGFTCVIE